MRTKNQIHKIALLGGVMALSLALTLLAATRAAQAADVCEEELVNFPTNSAIQLLDNTGAPLTPSVTSPVHVVTIAPAGTNEKVTTDCVTENGTSIAIYDAACTIGNGPVMNPCITSASTFSVVSLDASCGPLTQDIPALNVAFNSQCTASKKPNTCCTGAGTGTCSIPGVGGTITTSGPFANCATFGSIYPWTNLTGLFILGAGQSSSASGIVATNPVCPTAGTGGIGRCISYPQ